MSILFSLPVHENNECIRDTIANAKKYNPNCIFVIHVSANFHNFDISIGNIHNVFVNPIRFPTIHSQTSHVPLHLTNFKYAVDCGAIFDHVCILHTSEMFIKHETEDYIKNYDYSLWFDQNDQPRVNVWPPFQISYTHQIFKDLFDGGDPHNYVGNLIEGHWWKRELFEKMYKWTESHYNIMQMLWGYAAEEVYFATLGHHLSKTKNFSVPYNAFYHREHYLTSQDDVNDIRANKDVTIWQNNNWVYNKIPIQSKNLYSIKRVNRELNDPIRKYINSLDP